MAIEAILDGPVGAISELSDPDAQGFRNLQELATYFEFIDNVDYFEIPECLIFCDEVGRRYRILVIGLKVVLCVEVPRDFDPRGLRVSSILLPDSAKLLVESYGVRIHRAIRYPVGNPLTAELLDVREAARLVGAGVPALDGDLAGRFDLTWLALADPIGKNRRSRPAARKSAVSWHSLLRRKHREP